MTTATYTVTGMTCEHCVASVREEIEEISGTGAVEVTSDRELDTAEVGAAVAEAGYQLA